MGEFFLAFKCSGWAHFIPKGLITQLHSLLFTLWQPFTIELSLPKPCDFSGIKYTQLNQALCVLLAQSSPQDWMFHANPVVTFQLDVIRES